MFLETIQIPSKTVHTPWKLQVCSLSTEPAHSQHCWVGAGCMATWNWETKGTWKCIFAVNTKSPVINSTLNLTGPNKIFTKWNILPVLPKQDITVTLWVYNSLFYQNPCKTHVIITRHKYIKLTSELWQYSFSMCCSSLRSTPAVCCCSQAHELSELL